MLYQESEERPELKTMEEIDGELYIRFVFDIPSDKKKKYTEENYQNISRMITSQFKGWYDLLRPASSGNTKKPKTILEKHLESYVAKNTFDYFIHKDLRGFLQRELDFYIKSEVIHLEDLDTTDEEQAERWLAKVRAIKRVGKIIIDFLAQVEDFQKKLWLKKKFVVSTNWCITVDRIPEEFWPEIIRNQAQHREWIQMYAIDEAENYTDVLTMEFLRQNQNLIVDTKYFDTDFKDRLIASIHDLDEQTDGLLVHSENFQALNFLKYKYRGKVDCCYIDPPYNTNASEILYKNGYRSSSWASFVMDRIKLGKELLSDSALECITIDDFQFHELNYIMKEVFGAENMLGTVAIKNNPSGRSTESGFSIAHEYSIFCSKCCGTKIGRLERTQEQNDRYNEKDSEGQFEWVNFRKHGGYKEESPTMYYPIYVTEESLRIPELEWDEESSEYRILEAPLENEEAVYPIDEEGRARRWKWGIERARLSPDEMCVRKDRLGKPGVYIKSRLNDKGILPLTVWDKSEYSSTSNGTNLLKNIFGNGSVFLYPKSLYAVMDSLRVLGADSREMILDFFAGSATTGHAVIELNKLDGKRRKYILVEMGEYFDTATLPRMKKAVYSSEWKNGKPKNRDSGVSHIMKYISLESYEDSLSNIALSEEKHGLMSLFDDAEYKIEYLVNDMLHTEAEDSLLNLEQFRSPFQYRMKITRHNETKEEYVDLAETFQYLIGLSVIHQGNITYYHSAADKNGSYEGAVHLTADADGEYGFRQIEGILPDGRRALIIWRTVTEDLLASNAALDAYVREICPEAQMKAADIIYVNGDNNLEDKSAGTAGCRIQRIEPEFKARMFEEG